MARRKSNTKSTKFEQQIERIHRLLEEEGAEVKWNDHVPDPDNPSQLRQIDVTIRRNHFTTLVECRIHRNKQNVKWIEELIGRKGSLNADSVIAVSASGFTIGAIKKAARFGIILRSIYNLSEWEIKNWGKEKLVQVVYYEFTDTILTIKLPRTALKLPIALQNADGTPIRWRSLFETAMKALEDDEHTGELLRHCDIAGRVSFDVEIFADITVCDVKPLSMSLYALSRRIKQEVPLASVIAYTSPEDDPTQYARVGKYDLGAFEILKRRDFEEEDEVAVVVDVTPIVAPPNCFFHSVFIDFGRTISAKWCQIIGTDNFDFMKAQAPLQLQFQFI